MSSRRYAVNDQVFRVLNAQSAYALGFFCADGNIFIRRRGTNTEHRFNLTNTDRDILFRIRDVLGSTHPIGQLKGTRKPCYHLTICCRTLVESLMALGLTPRKSKTLLWPEIPRALVGHFIRGYFDGDGWSESFPNSTSVRPLRIGFVSGSKRFIVGLRQVLAKVVGKRTRKGKAVGAIQHQRNEYGSAYALRYQGTNACAVCDLMYRDAGKLFIRRKRTQYERWKAAEVDRDRWSAEQLAMMKREYPRTPTVDLAEKLNKSVDCLLAQARRMNLRKKRRACAICGIPGHLRTTCSRSNGRLTNEQRKAKQAGRKYRARPTVPNKTAAKLTWKHVNAIRRSYMVGRITGNALAAKYGVTTGAISMIVRNKTWVVAFP